MRLGVGVLCAYAVVWLAVGPVAYAVPEQMFEVAAQVSKVDAKTNRATINRGKRAGLRMGDAGDLFPMRVTIGDPDASVRTDIRLARGKIVELADDSAVLALDTIAALPEVGAYFKTTALVPKVLAASPVFQVAAIGLTLRAHDEDKPFITIEAMFTDPSDKVRDKAIDAMLAELHQLGPRLKNTAGANYGRHAGKNLASVLAAVDRAELLDFLEFLYGEPGNYAGKRMTLDSAYVAWVMMGALSGERYRKLREVTYELGMAKGSLLNGDLAKAAAWFNAVGRKVPDHRDAYANMVKADRGQLLLRRVAADPEDTAGRAELVTLLYELGADPLALQHNEVLRTQKYDPHAVEMMHGKLLERLGRWSEADQVFGALAKVYPADKTIVLHQAYARSNARGDYFYAGDFALQLHDWPAALLLFRRIVEAGSVTAAQRAESLGGQERVELEKMIEERGDWARAALTRHELVNARTRIVQIHELVDKLGSPERANEILGALADVASGVGQRDFALEIARDHADRAKTSAPAHTALALRLLWLDDLDGAEASAKQAVALAPSDPEGHHVLALVALARSDLANAETLANKALAASGKYSAARLTLARVYAAKGEWQDAVDQARRAVEQDATFNARTTLAEANRGLQAKEALLANAKSPRERLRMVRALAQLGLGKRAEDELAKLPATGTWRTDAWWALADVWSEVSLADRVAAGAKAKPKSTWAKRIVAMHEAELRLRKNPNTQEARLALARARLELFDAHGCLAELGPLRTGVPTKAVAELASDAFAVLVAQNSQNLADQAASRGDLAASLKQADAYIDVFDRVGIANGRLVGRETKMRELALFGKYDEALAVAEEARKIMAAEGEPYLVSLTEVNTARIRASIGTNTALREALEKQLRSCTDLDNETCLEGTHSELAAVAGEDGQLAAALEHARKAWMFAGRLGDADRVRRDRYTLADLSLRAGRISDGERHAGDLLADARKQGDSHAESDALTALGTAAMMRGDDKAALARFQEVYAIAVKSGAFRVRAEAKRREGEAWLFAAHDPRKAAVALDQSARILALDTNSWAIGTRGATLRTLAEAHLAAGNTAAARQAADESLALAKKFDRRHTIAALQPVLASITLAENKLDAALAEANEAVKQATQTDDPALLASAWYAVARASTAKKQNQPARDAYDKALAQLDLALLAAGGANARKGALETSHVRAIYHDAVEQYLASGDEARAMEILERSREAEVKQGFDVSAQRSKDGKLASKLERYQEARAKVRGLELQLTDARDQPGVQRSEARVKALAQQIVKTRKELGALVAGLESTHPRLYRALAISPAQLATRRAKLPKDTALVEYFVTDAASYAFVVTRTAAKPAVLRLPVGGAKLTQTIDAYRTAVLAENEKTKDREGVEKLGRTLDDWLLQPLRAHLGTATTLAILPFGPLHQLPFDSLVVSEAGKPLRYAIEDFRISIQSTTTIEALLGKGRRRGTASLLAIANADGTLPGATREVDRLRKVHPDAKVLGQGQATLAKFHDMAPSFAYLHLATHGILHPDPGQNYLKMSDGNLTIEQISELGLDKANELVVLSACETALEQDSQHDGERLSLAVAFALAGAPAVVASLWAVSDESTSELMSTFYRALEQNSADRLDALRNAKLALLKLQQGNATPYAEPFYWAAFQIYGDFRAPAAK